MPTQIPDLDLVVGGHSHTFLYNGPAPSREKAGGPYPTYVTVNDTDKVVPVVQAFAYTKYMGHLKLNFDLQTGDLVSPVQVGRFVNVSCSFQTWGHWRGHSNRGLSIGRWGDLRQRLHAGLVGAQE